MFGVSGVLGCLKNFKAGLRLKSICAVFLFFFLALAIGPAFSLPSDARREIRCLIFVEGNVSFEERVQAVFEDANKYLEREDADIVLVPRPSSRFIEFKGTSARNMLEQLRVAAAASSDVWDLAIAFTNGPLQGPKGQNWAGVIEKHESRHIVIKCLNRNTLLHEIGHALGMPHGTGIMLPTLKTNYVHLENDYREALKTARAGWPGKPADAGQDAAGNSAQKAAHSLRFAQAARN